MHWFGALLALGVATYTAVATADETSGSLATRPAFMVLDPDAPRPVVIEGEPVPEASAVPAAPRTNWGIPVIRSRTSDQGETIALSNDAMTVTVRIDLARHAILQSIRTGAGYEMLAAPAVPLAITDEKGTAVIDGAAFEVESWMPRQHLAYAEVELRLRAPQPVRWSLRLYRDKPCLEQTFSVPAPWRTRGRALVQVLPTGTALRPVMPNNVFGRGFAEGRPNLAGRHRFEYVAQSDHLGYDAAARAGLAAFVAGIGGEERVLPGALAMLDHVAAPMDGAEPATRFMLWPFQGPVERGFMAIKRFINTEYSCQRGKDMPTSWNQFWLWQGGIQPSNSQVVTADRLLDVLPHVAALGCEEFHLDAGWEITPGDWRFDPKRFPQGFAPLRAFLRERGMRYHTWVATDASADPGFIADLIEQTDLCKLFQDRTVAEPEIAAMREVRKRYPDFETFVHHTTSRSVPYWWGNIHFLSDFNQIYFGEGEFWAWSNVLPEKPEGDVNQRFFSKHSLRAGDLVTRSAAYQVHWAWPYPTVVPPHCGWAWFEHRDLAELASRMFTTLAARADYQWGEDPRLLRPEAVDFFMDWTAFFKTARPYLREYQHVLRVPDGIHPDGAAHVVDGRGFIILCNPGAYEAEVSLRELLWEPELELDPARPIELTDWTSLFTPRALGTIDLVRPEGGIALAPLSYKVISLNIDVAATLAEIRRQRAKLHGPDEKRP